MPLNTCLVTTALAGVSVLPSAQVMTAWALGVTRSSRHSVKTRSGRPMRTYSLPYPRGEENNAHCFDENNEVKEQRLVLDVVEIIRQLLTRVLL